MQWGQSLGSSPYRTDSLGGRSAAKCVLDCAFSDNSGMCY